MKKLLILCYCLLASAFCFADPIPLVGAILQREKKLQEIVDKHYSLLLITQQAW